MIGLRNLTSSTAVFCSFLVPISVAAMEVELVSVDRPSKIATNIFKRIDRTSSLGNKPNFWSMSKAMKTRLFNSHTELGKKLGVHPVVLDLSVTAKPNISPGKLKLERELNLTASKRLTASFPLSIETNVKYDESRTGSIFVIFKFSL